MKTIIPIFVIFFCLNTLTYAQVGINTVNPNALLEIQASNQTNPSATDGILIPKVDDFPAIDPSANQDGMLVFATGSGVPVKGFYFWDISTTSWKIISGALEKITESTNTGWRLAGQNTANHGDIGQNAIDLSISYSPSSVNGATGNFSFATGASNVASGIFSTSMGFNSYATGAYAATRGNSNTASGDYSIAMGSSNFANSYGEITLGLSSTFRSGNPTIWVGTDRLFAIGNGQSSARSDALEILKNGTITAPSFDIAEITDPKALVTKEFADTTYATPENPTVATLVGNWTPYGNGYETPRYYKHNGRVYLSGLLRNSGTMNSGDLIFTLPSSYRPMARRLCAGGQIGMSIRIDILANGNVLYMGGTSGSLDFVSLDGISFEVH